MLSISAQLFSCIVVMFATVKSLPMRGLLRRSSTSFWPSSSYALTTGVRGTAIITATSNVRLWSQGRSSFSSSSSETPFVVENDLSKMTDDLGGLRDVSIEKDTYLFGEGKMFDELEIHHDLFQSLKSLGKEKATSIQALSFQKMVSGRDVIIAAETGSGKTFAYLLPLIHQLLTIEDLGGFESVNESDIAEKERRDELDRIVPWYSRSVGLSYPKCMIIVPNKELCAQVCTVATEVSDALRKVRGRIVTVEALTSFNGIWPYSYRGGVSPNIIICTPSYIGNYIRGQRVLEEDLFRNLRCLIIDEADMLLEGSYQKEVERIMDAIKLVRRQMIREGHVDVHTSTLQYVLAAATLPSFGLKSTEKYIQKRFPRATKISNSHLHKHHPRIKQEFIELEEEENEDGEKKYSFTEDGVKRIVKAIEDVKSKDNNRRGTMIFVNTASTAVKLAVNLREHGIECAEFHKHLRAHEKENELKLFQSGEIPVLVCTDHASRGLDLPGVYHVIQAEFALNVVSHLHRIGRASRAGSYGRATNFYGKSSKHLVNSILSDVVGGKVEQSFSRKRGLRARAKKNNSSGNHTKKIADDES